MTKFHFIIYNHIKLQPTLLQISCGTLTYPIAAAFQTRAAVYLGRGRRRTRPVAHTEHRPDAANAFQALTG